MTFKLTEKQEMARELLSSSAIYYLLYGGSRSTKTFTFLRTIVIRALIAPESRHAVLRFRFVNVKQSVIYDTFPKLMKLCFPTVGYNLNKQDWFVEFPNGSQIWFGGLDDKERTEKILGNEYATVFLNECSQISYQAFLIVITRLAQRCFYERDGKQRELSLKLFCDENPPNRGHWTHQLFMEKVTPGTRKKLENPDDYVFMQMNPADNRENLPTAYMKMLDDLPKRQRDRFRDGIFSDESDNALWNYDIIERNRVSSPPQKFLRIVIAVDPSGASGDEDTNNDDIGIIAVGLGNDGFAYLLEDNTVQSGPAGWAGVVATTYERLGADRVIGESNFGGAMVEHTIKTANPNIPYKEVRASRSKMIRAEPVSALHEQNKIKFVGEFSELEDEMMNATTAGYVGLKSPNRLDAFVFAVTELFPGLVRQPKEQKKISIPMLERFG